MYIFFDTEEEFKDALRIEKIRRKHKKPGSYSEQMYGSFANTQIPGSVHKIHDTKVMMSSKDRKTKDVFRPGVVIDHPDTHNHFMTTWVPFSSVVRRNNDIFYVFLSKKKDDLKQDCVVLLKFCRKYTCHTLNGTGKSIRNEKLEEINVKLKRLKDNYGY